MPLDHQADRPPPESDPDTSSQFANFEGNPNDHEDGLLCSINGGPITPTANPTVTRNLTKSHHRKRLYNLYHLLNHLNLFGDAYLAQVLDNIDRLLSECR